MLSLGSRCFTLIQLHYSLQILRDLPLLVYIMVSSKTALLLFAICIEPHVSIMNNPTIFPINLGTINNHIGPYADDIILFLPLSQKCITLLLDLIKRFGLLSGYALSWQKCEFMPLTEDLDPEFINDLYMKCLGMVVPKQTDPLNKLLLQTLSHWKTLSIVWFLRLYQHHFGIATTC